jgi:hypothetical protein
MRLNSRSSQRLPTSHQAAQNQAVNSIAGKTITNFAVDSKL